MGRRIATVQWSSETTGVVLALVHPGGLLLTPITIHRVAIFTHQHLELRVEYGRHATKATGGILETHGSIADDGSAGVAIVRSGAIDALASPSFSTLDRIATHGPPVGGQMFSSGKFTVAPSHTFTVSLLDAVPFSVSHPLTFVVEYEE